MRARLTSASALPILLVGLAATILGAQRTLAQNFITVDYPGATLTSVREINKNGEMAGRYIDSQQVIHGFVLQNGVFTDVDFPEAQATAIWGIDDNGDVVGRYLSGETDHGFLLSKGVYTTIDPPGSIDTFALGINNVGQIVGFWTDTEGHEHGFLLSGGVYTTIDFPASVLTWVTKANNVGDMVGIYDDSSGNEHGFLLENGTFTSIDYPQATLTDAYGINDGGQIVGGYCPTVECLVFEGFEDNNGSFTTVSFPAAVNGLTVLDLNNAGQLAGEYYDANFVTHGFVSATGPFAYVANNSSNTVSMIDIPTQLVVNTISVGSVPLGAAISPDGTQVYVTNAGGNSVSVISTASSTVVATIPVQTGPDGVAFTPDGTSAYVVNQYSNSVSVINTASQTVTATVPVGTSPVGVAMALTSNGTFAYVSNSQSNNVSVIAVGEEPEVVQTIAVGSEPDWVAVSPNSSLAYVENAGSNNVSVISVASNTVTATIPVGGFPSGAAFSPDSSMAYVANFDSNTVSVIATASSSVVATVAGFNNPEQVALTTDGSLAYVTNFIANNVSVITTATNTITATIPVGLGPIGVAIASAPLTTLQITQPLSPTQPNVFNFGTNNQVVQYPPGTNFSNINMTTAAVQITQAAFQQRLVGTLFAGATCIIYAGSGGNCTDYQVTCSDNNGNPISCPGEAQPTIAVQTGFTTSQSIVNPGYLTTPIGENQWQNIFTGFSDPTVKGKTKGFSEFVAVSLGATNAQGAATLTPLYPAGRTFTAGVTIPVAFRLNSVATKQRVTDATAGLSVTMIADANGNPTSVLILSQANVFLENTPPGVYKYELSTKGYAVGKYSVTIFGNAFSSYTFNFKITP